MSRDAPIVPPDDPNTSDGTRAGQLAAILNEGADPNSVAARWNLEVLDFVAALNLVLFGSPDNPDTSALVALLMNDPDVGIIEANSIVQAPEGHRRSTISFSVPEVAVDNPEYGYDLVGAPNAGCVTGARVVVAVLDTGIDSLHPLFENRLSGAAWSILTGDNDIAETQNGIDEDGDGLIDEMHGHGTHVAGIIARVAPGATILPIKVLNDDGIGDAFGIAQGIVYATANSANVINLSLSSVFDSKIIRAAIEAAQRQGVVVVASTGNADHDSPKEYPAAIEGVIGVAATGPDDLKSWYSNYGEEISMSAPGTEIESALPGGGYGVASGTSMAAPFISAAVALTIERYPNLPANEVEEVIKTTSTTIDSLNPSYAGQLGAGRLDLVQALACSD